MITEELKQFNEIIVEKIKTTLPTERLSVEEHLFLTNVNFFHFAELMWSKHSKEPTVSYAEYLMEVSLEHLLSATLLAEVSNEELYSSMEDYYKALTDLNEKTSDSLLISATVLTDEMMLDPVFKVTLAIKILEIKYNLTLTQILDHYNNWQKTK